MPAILIDYSYVQNGTRRTIIIDEDSNIPFDNTRPNHHHYYSNYSSYTNGNANGHANSTNDYTNTEYTNRLVAQQPFPNNVRIKFSAPPLKQHIVKKSYKFSKNFFVILLFLIVIFLFEKVSN